MLDANSVKRLERALDAIEDDLLLQEVKIRRLLRSDHSHNQAAEFKDYVQDSADQIDDILVTLLAEKDTSKQFGQASKELCRRCRDLQNEVRSLTEPLTKDLDSLRPAEEKRKKDTIAYVTFLIGIPVMLSTAAKNGVGDGHVTPTQAFTAGFGLSFAVLARKKLVEGFKGAARTVCEMPDRIGNSFALFHARHEIMNAMKAIKGFVEVGGLMRDCRRRFRAPSAKQGSPQPRPRRNEIAARGDAGCAHGSQNFLAGRLQFGIGIRGRNVSLGTADHEVVAAIFNDPGGDGGCVHPLRVSRPI